MTRALPCDGQPARLAGRFESSRFRSYRMASPRDLVRSLVRAATEGAVKNVSRIGGLDRVRAGIDDLVRQRIAIKAGALTTVLAHLDGVDSASVTISDGAMHIDVAFTEGAFLQARLIPTNIRFAPRGAKEVGFRVEPREQAHAHRVTDVISAIGGAIASALWPVARIIESRDMGGAIVDRDGPDAFTVDLRTAPAIRALEQRGGAALVLEIIELGGLTATDGCLVLQLRLPQLTG